jgi:hypothetical protein
VQNKQLWRKRVDAIIEEYKRKWTESENKRSSITRRRTTSSSTPRSRTPERTTTATRITKYHRVLWTHAITKFRMKKR